MRAIAALSIACFVAGAVGVPAAVHAQTYEGPRLLGFADAQRALASGNDSIYANPAGMATGRLYSIELGYFDDLLGSDRRFNASVVDSQAGPVAGGLAYTYSTRRPDDVPTTSDQRLEGHRVELSLASPLGANAALGTTVRYLTYDRSDGNGFSGFQMDAGVQWRLWQGLSLGLVGYNLTNSDRPEMPISWGAGLGWQSQFFSLEADIRYNAQRGEPRYSFAGEVVLFEIVLLRGGGLFDYASKTWAISAGAGISVDKFALDVGFRQRLGGGMLEGDVLDGYGDARVFGASVRMYIF